MDSTLNKIIKNILSLQSINEADRSVLMADLEVLQKKVNESDFMIKRLDKDKSIVINILKTTIADLEKSKLEIEASNKQLLAQQHIIELKSKKLSDNLKKLENSYSELEEFSHIASHDLKSPLRSISGFAYLLQKRYRGQIDKEADEFLNFIVSSAKQMYEIIEALLEYSKVGIQQENFEEIDLNGIIELVENNLSRDIEENSARIIYEPLPKIKGDKISLLQLFQNLVGNAIKFRSSEPPLIQIKCETEGSIWKFEVIDNGIGLDESFQDKAFFPFQRLEERNNIGMGLGLAICKKVVKLHDGKIYYHKNIQKGTTFGFEIPVK